VTAEGIAAAGGGRNRLRSGCGLRWRPRAPWLATAAPRRPWRAGQRGLAPQA